MSDKRLYKSSANRIFAGVCGGIGEFFNVDPTLVRIITLIIMLFSFGTAAIIYVICFLLMPNAPIDDFETMKQANEDYTESKKQKKTKHFDDDFDSYFEKSKK